MARFLFNRRHQSVEVRLEFGLDDNSCLVINPSNQVLTSLNDNGLSCTAQGHCGACGKKWRQVDSDLCACGEPQTMSHIVDSCLLTKPAGGLSKLHSADDDAVAWLISYGSPQRIHTTTTTIQIAIRKLHLAYVTVAIPVTLSDLQGNAPVACVLKCDFFVQLCSC